jgi:hypothetical protein
MISGDPPAHLPISLEKQTLEMKEPVNGSNSPLEMGYKESDTSFGRDKKVAYHLNRNDACTLGLANHNSHMAKIPKNFGAHHCQCSKHHLQTKTKKTEDSISYKLIFMSKMQQTSEKKWSKNFQ